MAGDRLGRILAALADAGAESWSSASLCAVCPQIVGVDGAGVMLMSGDIPRGSLCTTNAVSHLIEELQYTLGEGPCVDAYRQDQVVAEPDLAEPATRRWLAFPPPALAARGLEIGAVFHFAVHNAAGMISAQLGISVTEALIRLRAFAFGNDRLLADVARDVVTRRLRLA